MQPGRRRDMRETSKDQSSRSTIIKYAVILAAGWTLLIVGMGVMEVRQEMQEQGGLSRKEARAHFLKDQAFWSWAERHGGVYVPQTEHTPPNPYLAHLPDRDVVTTTGMRLTLMNPAYMFREIMEEYGKSNGIKGRMTSLRPLRPENAPDAWERAALESFERGETEAEELTTIDGEQYLRLMRPMIVEKTCLRCHGNQGYKEGDIRGGVGVSVPAESFIAMAREDVIERGSVLALFWLIGMAALLFGYRQMNRRVQEREQSDEARKQSEHTFHTVANFTWDWEGWITPDRQLRHCSPSCERVCGYTADELIANPALVTDMIHSEDYEIAHHHWTDVNAQEHCSIEYRIITRSGETRWICHDCQPIIGDDGQFMGRRFSNRDITLQKQAEMALREERRLFIGGPTMVFKWRAAAGWPVEYVSPNVYEQFGYHAEDLMNNIPPYAELVHPDDLARVAQEVSDYTLAGDTMFEQEYRLRRADGEYRWLYDFTSVIRNAKGEVTHYLGYVQDITERKQVKEALSESENQYRTLFEKSADAILIIEGDKFTDCNLATVKMLGYKNKKELLETHPSQLSPEKQPDGKSSFDKANEMMSIAFDRGSHRFEWDHMRSNGEVFPVEVLLTAVPVREKTILHVVWRDITERKRAEATIVQRVEELQIIYRLSTAVGSADSVEQAYANVMNSLIEGMKADRVSILLFDADGIMRFKAWLGISEKYRNAVEGHSPWTQNEKDPRPILIENIAHEPSLQQYGDLFEKEGLKALGFIPLVYKGRLIGKFMVYFNAPHRFEKNEIQLAQTIASHVSFAIERKKAEDALRMSEEQHRTIIRAALDGFFLTDSEGRLQEVNDAYCRMSGYSRQELMGMSVTDIATLSPAEIAGRIQKIMLLGEDRFESQHRRKDGSIFDVEISIQYRADGNGQFTCFLRDITETKRLQQLESRAQRLETVGRIAGEVAHDFNNLLGPIMAYPELIRGILPEDHKALKYLSSIENAGSQIAAINQDLLTLGRRGHYTVEPLNINSIIKSALRELEPFPETMICETALCEDIMNFRGGAAQIHRAISNLIHNAKDALNGVGTLTVRTENYYADDVTVSYGRVPKGEYVKITISDTGTGIPDDIVQKIFEPFFTTKQTDRRRGSGLGLSVVDSVIRDHDGYLDLKTDIGQGTSFYLYLPSCRECETIIECAEIVGGTECILIVDDDEMQREVVTGLLSKLGYNVTQAKSGEEAIEMLKRNPASLLVLDMIMPGGIDGAETFKRAIKIYPDQKAIFVSGFSESSRVIDAQAGGAGCFVKKPLTLNAISYAVRKELDKCVDVPVG